MSGKDALLKLISSCTLIISLMITITRIKYIR